MKERKTNYLLTVDATWPALPTCLLEELITYRVFEATSVTLTADGVKILPAHELTSKLLAASGVKKISKAWYRIPKDIITSLIITAI